MDAREIGRRRINMNNLPTVFNFGDFQLRVVMINEEPWFVARDVCAALGLEDTGKAISRLDDDESTRIEIDHPQSVGKIIEVYAVNEPGLYSLILGSKKKEARNFKRWVTHEVLPTIRKTGGYSVQQNNVVPLSKDQALVTVLRTTADLVEGQQELRQEQQQLKQMLEAVDQKVEQQITLNSGEQRKVQIEIAKRVYELADQLDDQQLGFVATGEIVTDAGKARAKMFRSIHRDIKDRFAVSSYKDVRRCEMPELMRFINGWRPRLIQ
jgi:prophage antirepressor-like protein